MKRVLHIAEAPGGVERFLVTLLSKMKKYREFEHCLICSYSYDRQRFDGLVRSFECVPGLHNELNPINDIRSMVEVRHLIKKYEPDIIYAHSSKAGAIGRIANLGLGIPLVYNAHGWAFNMKNENIYKIIFYELAERYLAPLARKIVCVSGYEKKSALTHRICGRKKLTVINNGIDFREFDSVKPMNRARFGIPEDAFVVGTVGRIVKQKAPDVFINAAAIIAKEVPDAYFVIVGDGADRGKLERQIRSKGLKDRVIITGWVRDPLDYVSMFDVATLLSRWEAFGLALAEYMALGKPIVATYVDAIPYVLRDAGLMVELDDHEAAAKAVLRIREDAALRDRLVRRGMTLVRENYNAERSAREHVKLFARMI